MNNQVFIDPLRIIPEKIFTGNYKTLFHHRFYFHWYWNSIRIVLITILLRGFFVTLAAYAFAKLRFRFREMLLLLLLAFTLIPSDTTVIARYLMYKQISLIDSQWVIILPATFDVFFLFLLRQFFMGVPDELSESAIVDGCSHFKIYYKIVLPLCVPALITMSLFTFIWLWNDFVSPFLFISSMKKQMLTVGLQYFQGEAGANYGLQMAGASLCILIPVIMFSFAQKYFIQGIALTGIKG
ncbi:carbohydrate ABC transporter permease [Paenibacillus psychroresistens]|nr:carbohydrate ABC transporter permease [Paenibacillus psychroresistens]